jgi:hypothetical protein
MIEFAFILTVFFNEGNQERIERSAPSFVACQEEQERRVSFIRQETMLGHLRGHTLVTCHPREAKPLPAR